VWTATRECFFRQPRLAWPQIISLLRFARHAESVRVPNRRESACLQCETQLPPGSADVFPQASGQLRRNPVGREHAHYIRCRSVQRKRCTCSFQSRLLQYRSLGLRVQIERRMTCDGYGAWLDWMMILAVTAASACQFPAVRFDALGRIPDLHRNHFPIKEQVDHVAVKTGIRPGIREIAFRCAGV
jgi:hypothetical protein